MILIFIAFILHRALSGLRNGVLYAEEKANTGAIIQWCLAGMALLLGLSMWISDQTYTGWGFLDLTLWYVVAASCLCLSAIFSALATAHNDTRYGEFIRDIHLWTMLEQVAMVVAIASSGPQGALACIFATYPSVFFQKVIINRFSGLHWWENATDDPTGQTVGFPSLKIKIRRLTQRTRIKLAIISGVAAAITHIILN